jgi:hypothetical protein
MLSASNRFTIPRVSSHATEASGLDTASQLTIRSSGRRKKRAAAELKRWTDKREVRSGF